MFDTPVLFLIFNRPEITAVTFEEIRKQKPKHLFIAADGPRDTKENDKELCGLSRSVVSRVDWECDVKTLYRETNLGCKYAVSSAITWFFDNVESGIILEDDCLPNASFFLFCQQLLEIYKNNDKVMHISGANLNDRQLVGNGSYYPSKYALIWGWATWRRAWINYDLELQDMNYYNTLIDTTFKHFSERQFWKSRLKLMSVMDLDTWDYQWMFSIWKHNGICLNSNYNLITNNGFGENATHTTGETLYLTPERKSLHEILHPSSFIISNKAEGKIVESLHGIKRQNVLMYCLNRHFLQRCRNLYHKIQLKIIKRQLNTFL